MNFCAVSLKDLSVVWVTSSRVETVELVSVNVVSRAYCCRSDTVSLVLLPSVRPTSASRPDDSSCCAVTSCACSFRMLSRLASLRDLVEVKVASIILPYRCEQRSEHGVDG